MSRAISTLDGDTPIITLGLVSKPREPRDREHSLSAASIFCRPEHVHSDQVPLECPETAAPSSHTSAYSGDVSNEVLAHLANVHPRVLDDLDVFVGQLFLYADAKMLELMQSWLQVEPVQASHEE